MVINGITYLMILRHGKQYITNLGDGKGEEFLRKYIGNLLAGSRIGKSKELSAFIVDNLIINL